MNHRAPSRIFLAAIAFSLGAGCSGTAKPINGPGGKGDKASIRHANLPFKVLRTRGGGELDEAAFLSELNGAAAVCIGENHKNPHHHWAQLYLFDKLSAHNQSNAMITALGMEMFQRTFQGVLDDYLAARIDQKTMLSRTGYEDRWGFDWGFYGPTVELAQERKAALLALNTERELTKRVSRFGIPRLTPDEAARLPELDLENVNHRAWWQNMMGGMSSHANGEEKGSSEESDPHAPVDPPVPIEQPDGVEPDPADPATPDARQPEPDGEPDEPDEPGRADDRAEWIYTAQVLWDETMAEGAVKWLVGGDKRQVVILAGNGHCHDSGIVGRVKRRGVGSAVSVRPIIDKGDGEVAAELASPEVDYLFVMTLPQ